MQEEEEEEAVFYPEDYKWARCVRRQEVIDGQTWHLIYATCDLCAAVDWNGVDDGTVPKLPTSMVDERNPTNVSRIRDGKLSVRWARFKQHEDRVFHKWAVEHSKSCQNGDGSPPSSSSSRDGSLRSQASSESSKACPLPRTSSAPTTSGGARNRTYDVRFKLEVLDYYHTRGHPTSKERRDDTCREYYVFPGTLSHWLRHEIELRADADIQSSSTICSDVGEGPWPVEHEDDNQASSQKSESRFESVDTRPESVDTVFESVDTRPESVDTRLSKKRQRATDSSRTEMATRARAKAVGLHTTLSPSHSRPSSPDAKRKEPSRGVKRKRGRQPTPSDFRAKVVAWHLKNGRNRAVTCSHFGASKTSLYRWLREANEWRPSEGRRSKYSSHFREKAVAWHRENGASFATTCARFGASGTTLRKWVNAAAAARGSSSDVRHRKTEEDGGKGDEEKDEEDVGDDEEEEERDGVERSSVDRERVKRGRWRASSAQKRRRLSESVDIDAAMRETQDDDDGGDDDDEDGSEESCYNLSDIDVEAIDRAEDGLSETDTDGETTEVADEDATDVVSDSDTSAATTPQKRRSRSHSSSHRGAPAPFSRQVLSRAREDATARRRTRSLAKTPAAAAVSRDRAISYENGKFRWRVPARRRRNSNARALQKLPFSSEIDATKRKPSKRKSSRASRIHAETHSDADMNASSDTERDREGASASATSTKALAASATTHARGTAATPTPAAGNATRSGATEPFDVDEPLKTKFLPQRSCTSSTSSSSGANSSSGAEEPMSPYVVDWRRKKRKKAGGARKEARQCDEKVLWFSDLSTAHDVLAHFTSSTHQAKRLADVFVEAGYPTFPQMRRAFHGGHWPRSLDEIPEKIRKRLTRAYGEFPAAIYSFDPDKACKHWGATLSHKDNIKSTQSFLDAVTANGMRHSNEALHRGLLEVQSALQNRVDAHLGAVRLAEGRCCVPREFAGGFVNSYWAILTTGKCGIGIHTDIPNSRAENEFATMECIVGRAVARLYHTANRYTDVVLEPGVGVIILPGQKHHILPRTHNCVKLSATVVGPCHLDRFSRKRFEGRTPGGEQCPLCVGSASLEEHLSNKSGSDKENVPNLPLTYLDIPVKDRR